MSISSKLKEFDEQLRTNNAWVLEYFLEGLSREKIISEFRTASLTPSEELVELYQWKNGVQYKGVPSGKLSFGVNGVFYPLADSVKIYKDFQDEFVDYFPIFSDDSYLILMNKESKDFGKIFIYSPSLVIVEPEGIFDSLSCMIETFIIGFREGIFFYDADNYFDWDSPRRRDMAKKLNPNSSYWH